MECLTVLLLTNILYESIDRMPHDMIIGICKMLPVPGLKLCFLLGAAWRSFSSEPVKSEILVQRPGTLCRSLVLIEFSESHSQKQKIVPYIWKNQKISSASGRISLGQVILWSGHEKLTHVGLWYKSWRKSFSKTDTGKKRFCGSLYDHHIIRFCIYFWAY
jgi:hypothetical protein